MDGNAKLALPTDGIDIQADVFVFEVLVVRAKASGEPLMVCQRVHSGSRTEPLEFVQVDPP